MIETQTKKRSNLAPFLYEVKKYFKNYLGTSHSIGIINYFSTYFFLETIAGNASTETLLLVRGTTDVAGASNLGLGFY